MGSLFSGVEQLLVTAEGFKSSESASDYGGLSKYGISQREYPSLDIANLTLNRALLILKVDYWDKYQIGNINDQGIANQAFLIIINMDPIHAVKIIQTAVNACGKNKVAVDGVAGTETFNALNAIVPVAWLSDRMRVEAIRYHLTLTDQDKKQIPNFRGWARRDLL